MVDDLQPRRMSREARRSALLDAAARLLLSDERRPFSFDAIATEAAVSATLPYKYFDSIDDVADELYGRVVGAVDDETDRLLADSARSFDDKVRGALGFWCDTIRRDGPLLLRLTDGAAHPSLVRVIDERRQRAIAVWACVVESEFDVAPDAARVVAASITAGSSAALQQWTRGGIDRTKVIELFTALARAQAEAAQNA